MRTTLLILVLALAATPALAADAPDVAEPFQKAIAYAQKRCVKVYGGGAGREHGYATGLVVSPDGLILTAQGIYLSEERVRVVLPDGSRHTAEVLRRSEPLQAALLKIDAATPDHFTLAAESPVDQGDWVLAVSNAFNVAGPEEPLSVNLGIVSLIADLEARHRTQDVPYEGEILLIDAITSNPGAPGGALVTADGRLAGMLGKLFQSTSTNTRINYAVPAPLLREFVTAPEEPVAVGPTASGDTPQAPAVKKPYLGVGLFTLSGKSAPAYVDRVAPGSPAAAAGLRKDDLLLAVGSTVVRSCKDCEEAFDALAPGQPARLLVKRGREVLTLTVTPTAKEDQP